MDINQRSAENKTALKLTFLGAAGTVTGSRTLVTYQSNNILIDCGLFQGHKNLRQLNWLDMPFNVAELDAVILTHAHLDHSGALPRLVKQGFRGPIYASDATIDMCAILLKDSAKLQEEEADYANRHQTSRHKPALPLYTLADVERTLPLFKSLAFGQVNEIFPDIDVRIEYAGHILGAASVHLKAGHTRLVFSGDIGRPDAPVTYPAAPIGQADYIIMESTYGNRDHPKGDPDEQLAKIINATAAKGGAVVIPAFAVGRSQAILHAIATLKSKGLIGNLPVFLDSPMAVNMAELYLKHHKNHRFSRAEIDDIFNVAHMVRDINESKALNMLKFPRIIVTASGMLTGGRVLHHLKHLIGDHRNAVVMVGFQAAGTRGQRLLAGEKTLKIFGHEYSVKASIHGIDGYSAHADATQLMDWLDTTEQKPKQIFLNHGEPQAADVLRQRIEKEFHASCSVPLLGEVIEIK